MDTAFVSQVGRWKHYQSPSVIPAGLTKAGWCRLVDTEGEPTKALDKRYKWDDWDVLAMGDRVGLQKLFTWNPKVWRYVPTIFLSYATGISSVEGPRSILAHPAVACAEMANMLCATVVQMASNHHKNVTEKHYRRIFSSNLVDDLMAKIHVVSYGIDVTSITTPRTIREPLRILFPHRTMQDKGKNEFLAYCEVLRKLLPDKAITLVMSRQPNTPVWVVPGIDVQYFKPPPRQELFDIFRSCDVVFSSALHENWGLAVMEAVACGCRPILPNRLAYPELHPSEYLYSSPEQAAQMTMDSLGTTFDNSYVEEFLWPNIVSQWETLSNAAYATHFAEVGVTKATEKIATHLEAVAATKKEILKFMGWGQLTAWGKYRAALKAAGVPITNGPNPIFGQGTVSQSLF